VVSSSEISVSVDWLRVRDLIGSNLLYFFGCCASFSIFLFNLIPCKFDFILNFFASTMAQTAQHLSSEHDYQKTKTYAWLPSTGLVQILSGGNVGFFNLNVSQVILQKQHLNLFLFTTLLVFPCFFDCLSPQALHKLYIVI